MVTAPFFTFALVFAIAFVIPYVVIAVPYLRFPTAILEIICGMLVGKSGLHLIVPPDWIHVITKLGLLYLMFLAGLEIRSHRSTQGATSSQSQKQGVGQQLSMAAVHFTVTMAAALAAGQLLYHLNMANSPFFIGLMFATTSLGVVVPILKESGLLKLSLGQTLLTAALFADFGTVVLVPFTLRVNGLSTGHPLLSVTVLTALGFALYFSGKIILRSHVFQRKTARMQQLGVRGALALMGTSGAISQSLGGGVILGGFVSGLVCSLLAKEEHEVLRKKLEILGYAFFLPLFFITVGMDLDLSHIAFAKLLGWLPAYILLAFLVKLIASVALWPRYRGRVLLASSALLSTRFTLVIAVALTAARAGVISGTEEGALVVTSLVTVIVSPVLFTLLLPKNYSGQPY